VCRCRNDTWTFAKGALATIDRNSLWFIGPYMWHGIVRVFLSAQRCLALWLTGSASFPLRLPLLRFLSSVLTPFCAPFPLRFSPALPPSANPSSRTSASFPLQTETHVAHHVSSKIPHHNAWKATAALKEFLGEHYQYRDTSFMLDLYRNVRPPPTPLVRRIVSLMFSLPP
jgi:fatty acid desaturase